MSKALLISIALILGVQFNTPAQNPVPLQVRLICYDLLIYPATVDFGGWEDENRVSSQGPVSQPNDEMAFAPPDVPTSHWGTFHYTDGFEEVGFTMDFEINIPGRDANDNDIPDLLEFDQAVPQTPVLGEYFSSDIGDGQFQITWSKPADSHRGSARILFDFLNAEFSHTLEILNYTGPWTSAVRESGRVHGPVTLMRAGTDNSTLSGELNLTVGDDVSLTTTSLLSEEIDGVRARFEWPTADTLQRDRTEFYTFLDVIDGWVYEQTLDFHTWIFIVDDKNDFDRDGIPDLVDPPPIDVTAPTLQIIKTPNGVRLSIVGDIGETYTLENTSVLPAAQWGNPIAVTLNANPHIIDLPAPSFPTFWRMRFP
jgi:hypothetical protein